MIIKYSQGGKINYEIMKYVVDTEEELKSIPLCIMSSSAYVITTGETWMMSSDKKWYPVTNLSKSPIECDCIEESTIWGDLPTV